MNFFYNHCKTTLVNIDIFKFYHLLEDSSKSNILGNFQNTIFCQLLDFII